jgi:hypothetical protein
MKSCSFLKLTGIVATVVATLSASSIADAKGYGAIGGTTANKSVTNWFEFNVGGVQNTAGTARDWLMPIDTRGDGCHFSPGCRLEATIRGGSTGNTCVTAYVLNAFGAITAQLGPVCQGAALATRTIGTITTSSDTMLVVANVAGGATPGAVTSINNVSLNFGDGSLDDVGAIRGSTSSFSTTNWAEHNVGGVMNRATTAREWLISVPRPHLNGGKATFGGGFGGTSCVIAYGVAANGSLLSGSAQTCHSAAAQAFFSSSPSSVHVLYVARLARASSSGAADGGFITSVGY